MLKFNTFEPKKLPLGTLNEYINKYNVFILTNPNYEIHLIRNYPKPKYHS
ncbi:hypothetical protein SAMN04489722_10549 [Algibacter lectus]|nr:hypothetical protein SAMN04489722_10549 [Algibacter lectus]